jgi:hypothetical protein
VWARAEEGWSRFDSADGPQQNLTVVGELVGHVEEGGGEPAGDVAGIAVVAVGQVTLDDRLEARLTKIAAEQPVQGGGIAADRGRRQDATWAKNAAEAGTTWGLHCGEPLTLDELVGGGSGWPADDGE